MKWLIILMVVVMPVITFAEDEGAPGADPAAFAGAPEVESPSEPRTQEPGRDGDPAKTLEGAEKAPATRGDKDVNSGVRFQSIEDLNKLGR